MTSEKLLGWGKALARPLGTILLSLLVGVLLILPTGTNPMLAYASLFKGAFGSLGSIYNTLSRSTPLIFTGLAAAFAYKAGVFNIGVEGQLYMGALFSAVTGIYLGHLPGVILIPLCLLSAMVGGMLWSIIPGLFTTRFGINIVVVSVMMNNIATLFTAYLATYPLKGELPYGATHKIGEGAQLRQFYLRSEFNAGFFIALATAAVLYILVFKTKFGYELRALGQNPSFTRYIGVDTRRKTMIVLFISGMVAGLGGAEQVMGVTRRFVADYYSGYGFTGITVALLGGLHPLGVIVGAIFFGALSSGAIQMEIATNVSRDLISSLQAVMILLLAAEQLIKWRKRVKQSEKEGKTI